MSEQNRRTLAFESFDAIPPAGPLQYLAGEEPLTAAELTDPRYVDTLWGDVTGELHAHIRDVKQALTEPFAPTEIVRLARLLGALRAAWDLLREEPKEGTK